MRRLFDLTVVSIWVLSLAGLIWHDLLPAWTAGQPPSTVPLGSTDEPVRIQFDIQAERWGRIGQSWVQFWRTEAGAMARSTTLLTGGPLASPVRVETDVRYDRQDRLDELHVWVYGLPWSVHFQAASYGQDFPCVIEVGERRHEFTLRAELASAFAEVFRPFVYLRGLQVGQTWRLTSVNPLGTLWGQMPTPTPIVARVVGKEQITHAGRRVECFRVETDRAVAWVDEAGRVLVQRVEAPVLGTMTIRMLDGFDEAALGRARAAVSRWK